MYHLVQKNWVWRLFHYIIVFSQDIIYYGYKQNSFPKLKKQRRLVIKLIQSNNDYIEDHHCVGINQVIIQNRSCLKKHNCHKRLSNGGIQKKKLHFWWEYQELHSNGLDTSWKILSWLPSLTQTYQNSESNETVMGITRSCEETKMEIE